MNPSKNSQQHSNEIKTLMILGASGDLTARLLLPGLASLISQGGAKGLELVGTGYDEWSQDKWREQVKKSFDASSGEDEAPTGNKAQHALDAMAKNSSYHQVDVTAEGALSTVLKSVKHPVAVYFALPPSITEKACDLLSADDRHRNRPEHPGCAVRKPLPRAGVKYAAHREGGDLF